MNKIMISNQDARRFLLAHQYLSPPSQLTGKEGVLAIFERFGSIQYDTINVVGRNADLVLQSRIQNYRPELLNEMLYTDRVLIDCWDKMASLGLAKDWPHFTRRREHMYAYHMARTDKIESFSEKVLKAIREKGPLSSLDFKSEDNEDVAWFWGVPTKLARATLEALNAKGIVGIHHKVNTRRVFDLVENLLPPEILNADEPIPDDEAFKEWHILRRLGSMGLASLRSGEYWLGMALLRKATDRKPVINRLVERGDILPVRVEGLADTLYMRATDLPTLEQVQNQKQPPAQVAFIAPLDNFIWNRRLIGELFDFSYVWEVYKPKKDRMHGYYTMPVIYGDRFIARIDSKLDRKSNILTVNGWWWETGVEPDAKMKKAIAKRIKQFMTYLNTSEIVFSANAQDLEKLLSA